MKSYLMIAAVMLGVYGGGLDRASADFYKGQQAGYAGDMVTAVKEWESSANQGDVDSQRALGMIYRDGDGVPQDFKEAVKWYSLAAEQGDAAAQRSLGYMYLNGEGVIQDYIFAHMWGNISASNDGEARLRDWVAKKMTPTQISEAQRLARECVKKEYKGC